MDEAFAAGMLHDTGRLVLITNLTEQYGRVVQLARERHLQRHEAEQEVFNATHAEVGAYLLGLWGLPVAVVEAINFHHYPARSASRTFCPLTAVHVANVLVQETAPRHEGMVPSQLDLDYLGALGLGDRVENWRAALLDLPQQR
jgi:HD-like signal output (HDOD) protein